MIRIMAYPLIGAKQLPEPVLIYCQLGALEQILVSTDFGSSLVRQSYVYLAISVIPFGTPIIGM